MNNIIILPNNISLLYETYFLENSNKNEQKIETNPLFTKPPSRPIVFIDIERQFDSYIPKKEEDSNNPNTEYSDSVSVAQNQLKSKRSYIKRNHSPKQTKTTQTTGEDILNNPFLELQKERIFLSHKYIVSKRKRPLTRLYMKEILLGQLQNN